jgi:hypothetical protein
MLRTAPKVDRHYKPPGALREPTTKIVVGVEVVESPASTVEEQG